MQHESWLVKKDRVWAMRFFQDKHSDEDGTTYMRVHYASCMPVSYTHLTLPTTTPV